MVTLVPGVTGAALAIDDTNVYFTTDDGAGVSGVPKLGGPAFVVAIPGSAYGGRVLLYLADGVLY